ncbi:nucleoside triphosphate pyrophosphohydrolase [Granulosicoccus antarcticus]|uniref:Nucleoside triphosphate pyrophosphohydrolase n=1 Tax=Granulosicoccus antarcticus IMCC3135 TaxID=1192854 RepID=A0A2Z2NKK9_9GAMM|nr:nucleoside triphosphate pyrophosphohydrolase [Granulosicoccus antarcticus]ASJ70418.1 Nucleoside triphosphate pyrophosphohydrolase [Granulosicoccus antarcticus IMCC3135]
MNTDESALPQLLAIMRRLRDPQSGCAWDVKQTFQTIAPFTVEEAYEVADAIERNDLDDLRDELGDLLFQVVFHAQIASEMGAFNFDDVAQSIVDKMTRRHPHVFAGVTYESEEALKAGWEAIKAEERRLKLVRRQALSGTTDKPVAEPVRESTLEAPFVNTAVSDNLPHSAVDGIARNLPALKRADKLQKRCARVGFDWPEIEPVWHKLAEEIAEVKEALASGEQDAVEDEIGDLLFTVVNLARHCSIDSEQALQRASNKFETRYRRVEQLAAGQSAPMTSLSLEQLDALWDKAKKGDAPSD